MTTEPTTNEGNPDRPFYIRISPATAVTPEPAEFIAHRVVTAIEALFNSALDINQVEFLSFPTSDAQAYLLSVTVDTVPDRSGGASNHQLGIESITSRTDPVEGSLRHATSLALEKLDQHLPSGYDLDPVMVDMSPLGHTPVTTARLLTERNRRIQLQEYPSGSFETLLAALNGEPHLYQVLVRKKSRTEYLMSVRIALFGLEHQLRTDMEFAEAIRYGRAFYPVNAFDMPGIASNLSVMPEYLHGWTAGTPRVRIDPALDVDNPARIRRLAKGHNEYRDLLRGRMDFPRIYSQLDRFPKFVGRQRDLCHFVVLPNTAYSTDPWADVPARDAPAMHAVDIENPSPSLPADAKVPAAMGRTPSQKDGNAKHRYWIDNTPSLLREFGFEVEIVDQNQGNSVPDLIARSPQDQLMAVEIASESRTKPAAILINTIRAEQWDLDLLYTGVDKTAAKKVVEILSMPFKDIEDDRTLLYNAKTTVTTPDGDKRLLPTGAKEAKWFLSPDGTLSLVADGDRLGSGPAEDGTSTFTLETPVHRTVDGTHVVETPDGAVRNRYDDADSLTADWTYLKRPIVPTRLTYIDDVDVRYATDDQVIETYDPSAPWDTPKAMARYEGALQEYFPLFTVAREDTELLLDTVREHALSWYQSLTDHKTPTKSVFGKAEPDYLTKKGNMRETTKDRYYKNRTWRYPRGLDSPDLPDFEADIDLLEKWRSDN